MLVGDAPYIDLAVGSAAQIKLESVPIFFRSPVSTDLPHQIDDASEEDDDSTIIGPPPDEEENE